MKKKYGLWLNIVTICLCVCAIAIGVYAATSATLTVSGQIGFEAHDVEFTAIVNAKGYVTDPNDATTYQESFKEFSTMTDNKITIDDMYFTDIVGETIPSIVIQISITNSSLFPVEATLSLPTGSILQENISFDVENGVAQMGDKDDATTKTQTMTITMTLNDEETTDLETLQDLNFVISLNRYKQIKGDSTDGYYMTMGSNVVETNGVQQVEAVKWIPFAESSDGSTWVQFENTNKPDLKKQYYFISEKVLDIGNWTVDGGFTYNSGVPYSNNHIHTVDGEEYTYADGKYSSLAPNNYLASNVRNLLNGEEVSKSCTNSSSTSDTVTTYIYEPSGEKVDLLKEYGITGYVYDNILARSTDELYEIDYNNVAYADVPEELKTSDKLWILSKSELTWLPNVKDTSADENLIAKTFHDEVRSYWWLRSPIPDPTTAWMVENNGGVSGDHVGCTHGVRPAFKINLS